MKKFNDVSNEAKNTIDLVDDCFQEVIDESNVKTYIVFSAIIAGSTYRFKKEFENDIPHFLDSLKSHGLLDKNMSVDDFAMNHLGINIGIHFNQPPPINSNKDSVRRYFDFKFTLEKLILSCIDKVKKIDNRLVTKSEKMDATHNEVNIFIFPRSY